MSSSPADELAARLPLLEVLTSHTDNRIAEWVKAAIPEFKDKIEKTRKWEAAEDRQRDERFEW